MTDLNIIESLPKTKFNYRQLYRYSKKNALNRKKTFDLTYDEFEVLVEKANGRCMFSGIVFSNAYALESGVKRPFAPSIDRIDSKKGYSLENCRLVCVIVNLAMNEWGEGPLKFLLETYRDTTKKPDAKTVQFFNDFTDCEGFLEATNYAYIQTADLEKAAKHLSEVYKIETRLACVPVAHKSDLETVYMIMEIYPIWLLQESARFLTVHKLQKY